MTPQNQSNAPTHDIDGFLAALSMTERDALRARLAADPDPDALDEPDDNPFESNEQAEAMHELRERGMRGYNTFDIEAIEAAGYSRAIASNCSCFMYRLNRGHEWWTKTASQWADDLGIGVDAFERARDCLLALKLLRRRIGRCNVARFQLDQTAVWRFVLAYAKGHALIPQGFAGRFPQNRQSKKSPVDNPPLVNSTLAVLPKRFGGFAETLEGVNTCKTPETPTPAHEDAAPFIGPPMGGDFETREPRQTTSDPQPVGELVQRVVARAERETSAVEQSEHEQSVAALVQCADALGLHIPAMAFGTLVRDNRLTLDGAHELARQASNAPARGLPYFRVAAPRVAEQLREKRTKNATTAPPPRPIGVDGLTVLANPALDAIRAIEAERRSEAPPNEFSSAFEELKRRHPARKAP